MQETITADEYRELKFQVTPQMKYRNQKVVIDGHKFDSKAEAAYYGKKKLQLLSGELINLELQVRYDFVINGVFVGFYKCDFRETWKSGRVDVVDVKGMKTAVYGLKKKLMKAVHGIIIKEVK